jgi:hypothetical protein
MLLKKYKTLIIIVSLAVMFWAVYTLSASKYFLDTKNADMGSNPEEKATIISNSDEVLPLNMKITLKLKSADNNREQVLKTQTVKELQDKIEGRPTLKSIEQYYKTSNYSLSSRSEEELLFVKESKHEPGKYYLGFTEDGFAAVFKCDEEGNLVVENPVEDISYKKGTNLPEADRKALEEFLFKYDDKEEAKHDLDALST